VNRPHTSLALFAFLALLAPAPAAAQLVSAGAGPAYPSGDFDAQLDPGNGLLFTGRVNLSLLFLSLQFELAHARWTWDDAAGETSAEFWQPGVNLGFYFIRVGPVRPYVLAGVIGSNQHFESATYEDSGLQFGWQAGGGIDFKLGPLRPFVEYRLVQLDGPGGLSVKYSPLIFGVGIF
jgi:opacity protein-like surface antigen